MDLLCMPAVRIGLVITAYYIGFAVGGLMYNWPEKYGRKRSVLIGMAISIVSQTFCIYWPNFYVRTIAFGGMGLS